MATGQCRGQERCRCCLEETVSSGDHRRAGGNTAAGVKCTLRLLGWEETSRKSHPALQPSAQPVHGRERGGGYRQTQTLPPCQPQPTEHFPFPLPVTHARREGHRLPATQAGKPEAAGRTPQSRGAAPQVGDTNPGTPVSIEAGHCVAPCTTLCPAAVWV